MNTFLEWGTFIADWVIVGLIIRSIMFEKKTYEMAVKEYEYDEAKDIEKKQKRTRTTKKTTTKPGGETMTEETTETSEPMNQDSRQEEQK